MTTILTSIYNAVFPATTDPMAAKQIAEVRVP